MVEFNPQLEDKRVHIFPKSLSPKVSVKTRLEFELTYYNVAVKHIDHLSTKTLTHTISFKLITDKQLNYTNIFYVIKFLSKPKTYVIITQSELIRQKYSNSDINTDYNKEYPRKKLSKNK